VCNGGEEEECLMPAVEIRRSNDTASGRQSCVLVLARGHVVVVALAYGSSPRAIRDLFGPCPIGNVSRPTRSEMGRRSYDATEGAQSHKAEISQ